jgi:nicotinamide N-methyltransferase
MESVSCKNYQDFFDPSAYLSTYSSLRGKGASMDEQRDQLRKWQLRKIHDFYRNLQEEQRALKILEFGGGPVIHPLISAAPYAKEIVFSEYVSRNRAAVESWKNKELHAPNYHPLIQYVVTTVEGHGMEEVERREQLLRDKIVAIVPCDVYGDPPVGAPMGPEKYDVLSTHFCLVTACESIEMYRDGLRKLASLVRPGGYILASEAVGASFYMLGGVKFPDLTLDKDVIRQALVDAGFSRDICFYSLPMEKSEITDCSEYLVISASKCD